ncbi:MAG: hypothetical protein ABR912_06555 [Terracidiphilus sp.]|jgi:hypothetical protein
MKFSFGGIAAAFLCLAISPGAAQTAAPSPPPPAPAGQAAPPDSQVNRQVIFSRSIDEDGQTTTQSTQTPAKPAIQIAAEPSAEDAERQAVTFTALDLDVRLRTAEQHIAVRALVTVRNDGKTPLTRIPLQISSSLDWERIRVSGRDAAFSVATLNSDADHTGQLHEAAIPLAQPLAPGASLPLDVTYSGVIAPSAQRLLAIGTPEDLALASDWDQIGVAFTGLRGFGNVAWYPVASVPVILGDGARLFDAIGEHKLRLSGARFRLRLTVEFPHGQAPTVALIDGHPAALTVTEPAAASDEAQEVASVATASLDGAVLGFEAPSLFVAIRTPHPGANLAAWTLPDDDSAAQSWTAAETQVTPFLQGWLGQRPRSQLTLLDLPGPQDAPFETGALLAAPIRQADPPASLDKLDGILVHALTHAWIDSPPASPQPQNQPPPAWLDEGVAGFMGTLWIEKQLGRERALGSLEAFRGALALAEPESPGQSPGQPLASAISPVYYRTKAAYVLWMLRDLASDSALSAALRAYNPAALSAPAAPAQKVAGDARVTLEPTSLKGTGFSPYINTSESTKETTSMKGTGFSPYIDPSESTRALAPEGCISGNSSAGPPASAPCAARSPFERLLEDAGARRDLSWFFADWVDADKGLPDLTIEGVFPSATSAGNWLVAVNVANSGYAAAEVPVTVRSASASVTQRLLVPARGKAVQRILIQGQPTEVQVNDGTVPETQASVHITKLNDAAGSSSSSSQPSPPQP